MKKNPTNYLLALVAASLVPCANAQTTWSGATSTDWNLPTNWSAGVPNGNTAIVNSPSLNSATVSATPITNPSRLNIGYGAGLTGVVNVTAGTLTVTTPTNTQLGIFVGGGNSTSNGRLNVADVSGSGGVFTGLAQGSGSILVNSTTAPGFNGRLFIGGDDAGADGGTGVMNVHTSGSVIVRDDIVVGGNGASLAPSNGTLNIDSGRVSSGAITENAWSIIGVGAGGTGTLNMSGGTYDTYGRIYLGRNGGSGTLNLRGGSISTQAGVVAADNFEMHVGQGAGSVGVMNISGTGDLNVLHNLKIGNVGTGTVNHNSALSTVDAAELWVGEGSGGNGTYHLTSGTVTTSSWVAVGRNSGTGVINVSGGTLTKGGTTATHFTLGTLGTNANGTLNLSSGLVDIPNGNLILGEGGTTSTGTLNLTGGELRADAIEIGRGGSATGNANLDGGTLKVDRFFSGATTGAKNIFFNGTEIIAQSDQPAFMANTFTTADIEAGEAKFNSNGFNIGIAQLLTGTGDLRKTGAGTLILSGANTYTGASHVDAGTLQMTTNSTGAGSLNVADGAAFGVSVAVANGQLALSSAVVGTSTGAALNFDLSTYGSPTVAPIGISGNYAANGTITINVSGSNLTPVQIPLISYGTKSGAPTYVIGSLPLGVVANIVDNVSNNSIDLNITSVADLEWQGQLAGQLWNINTDANWNNVATGTPNVVFNNGYKVTFNDTATGFDPVLNVSVLPLDVIFDNATNYTLTGTGTIAGAANVLKKGTGIAAVSTNNTYTEVTRIEAGTLSISSIPNGGIASPLGASTSASTNLVLAGGTLAYTGASASTDRGFQLAAVNSVINTTNDLTVSGTIASTITAANLTKTGAGTLSITTVGTNTIGAATAQGLRVSEGDIVFDGTAGAQINNIAGELWVSDTVDVSCDLTVTSTTLNVAGWIALTRGNGDNGACTATFTNSTINSGNFSCGYNNGIAANLSETTIIQSKSNFTNTGTTHIAESVGTTANWTLQNNSNYTGGNTLNIGGNGVGTTAVVTLKDTSSLLKNGAGTLVIGNGGGAVGTVNLEDSSTLTVGALETYLGNAGPATTGILNVKDSSTATFGGTVFVGKSNVDGIGTSLGLLNQTGGTVNAATWLVVGRYVGAQGTYDISNGVTNQTAAANAASAMIIGEAGTGTLNISGGALNINGAFLSIAKVATGVGTVNLEGGIISAKQVLEEGTTGGSSTFNFDGGTLRATAASTNFLAVDTANVLGGGALIDSNSFDVTIAQNLTGTGGLTKLGAGTLTMSATNSYTGNTTVFAGTLSLADDYLADAASVTIATGATINLTHTDTDIIAALTIDGTPVTGVWGAIGSGAPNESPSITGTGRLQVGTPYNAWATAAGLTSLNNGLLDDPDHDCMANLLEYFLDGNPLAFTAAPTSSTTATTTSLTFKRRDDAEGDITTQQVETSTDLTSWTSVTIPSTSGTVGGVTFTVTENASAADDITATITNGANVKYFLRLKLSE